MTCIVLEYLEGGTLSDTIVYKEGKIMSLMV